MGRTLFAPDAMAGKVALVTGAASGIGRATAIRFGSFGASVVAVDIDASGGEETVNLVRDRGNQARFVRADVAAVNEVEGMVAATIEQFGGLDFACNCAAISRGTGLAADITEEDWDATLNVNLKGVWLCMKYEIIWMLGHGGGSIVNISSVAGLRGWPNVPYTASKHGVLGLTRATAIQYAEQGIRVNAVCPGAILTPLLERGFERLPELRQKVIDSEPIGRLGQPEEIADAVIWLCSDAASFVTASSLIVDGGMVEAIL